MIGIRDQREGQAVFADELRLRLGFVRRDADDLGVVLREFFGCVAKLARFLGSAGRIGLGKKVDDDALAPEPGELECARADVGGAIADLKSHMPRL
jgi:hypothetical protein